MADTRTNLAGHAVHATGTAAGQGIAPGRILLILAAVLPAAILLALGARLVSAWTMTGPAPLEQVWRPAELVAAFSFPVWMVWGSLMLGWLV
jgi:hypothetical protein